MESTERNIHYRKKAGVTVLLSMAASLLILLSGCGGGGSSSGAKGSIRGSVRNSEGTSLPHATVTAGGKSTTTDNSGNFTLSNVSAGTQTISASLTGYFNDGRGSASVQVVAESNADVSNLVLVT